MLTWILLASLVVCGATRLRGSLPYNDRGDVNVALSVGTEACPPLRPKPDPLAELKKLEAQPDLPYPKPPANYKKPFVPKVYMPPPPKIGVMSGHPTKNEMDTLDALYRMTYREGFQQGWNRAEKEKVRDMENGVDEENLPSADEMGASEDEKSIAENLMSEVTATPKAIEDGGKLSEKSAEEIAVVDTSASIGGAIPEEDVPVSPDPPYTKADSNDLADNEYNNGFAESSDSGPNRSPADMIKRKSQVPSPKSRGYLYPSQIAQAVDAQTGTDEMDRDSLCAFDPEYCTPKSREGGEYAITTITPRDGFYEKPDET